MTQRYGTLKNKHGLYLPFLLLGYPSPEATLDAARILLEEGADGLELGLPFRDPVADGPVIAKAAGDVLDAGFTTDAALALVKKIRNLSDTAPLTLMVYYNMVFARGSEKFIADFAAAGIDGLLIPDMPPERAAEIAPFAKKYGIELVFIAAPTSGEERLRLISQEAAGFVYVVTRLGITGTHEGYSNTLPDLFARIRKQIDLPMIAGFGISEGAHAHKMMEAGADGVITGSRLVEILRGEDLEALRQHTKDMRAALNSHR